MQFKSVNVFFREGFNSYISGSWAEAEMKFIDCLKICENDGPTCTLLDYMKQYEFKAPNDWAGFRKLSSK